MIASARRGFELMLGLGALLACETRVPASAVPASQSAADGRAAAGASAVIPVGGAPGELNGGVGGSAPEPAGSSGMGGNDTGSGGGSAGNGPSGGSSGASGRDVDPSSADELRYALWLGQTAISDAPPASLLPGD